MKIVNVLVGVLFVLTIGNAQDIYNKAKAALSAKDTASAMTAFENAIRSGQKTSESNYYLGAIAFRRGKVDEAINYLSAAVRSDDENVDALIALGDAYIVKKDNTNAVAQYKRALKIAPKNCRVLAAYGAALVELDQIDGPEGAIVQLTRAKECDDKNPNVYISLGDAYNKQNVRPLANMNYEKALELSPNDVETQMKIARTYAANRQYTEAVQAFESAVKIDSTNFEAYFEAGKILFRAKLYKRAVPFMYRATNLRPKDPEAASIYEQSLVGAEYWVEAAKAGAVAVQLDSASVENWRAYAAALVETRDYKKALDAYDILERRQAIQPEDYAKLGQALFSAGQEDKALEVLLKAVAADSTNCDPYFNLGFLYMKKQDYQEAAKMFEKKLACDPRSLSSYLNAGLCYMQEPKNLPRARELFLKTIELKPDFLQGQIWLARYYLEVDSLDMMKQTYDNVVKLANENPGKYNKEVAEAFTQLGSYYFGKKNYGAALDYFRKAVGYNETAGLQLTVGQCLILTRGDDPDENRRRTEEAVTKFRRSIQLDPNNGQAHYWLGLGLTYLRKEGDPGNKALEAEACSEYAKALRLDPRNDEAKKAMARIGCK